MGPRCVRLGCNHIRKNKIGGRGKGKSKIIVDFFQYTIWSYDLDFQRLSVSKYINNATFESYTYTMVLPNKANLTVSNQKMEREEGRERGGRGRKRGKGG